MTNTQAEQIADYWHKREQAAVAGLLSGWVEVLERLSSAPDEALLRAELARCLAEGCQALGREKVQRAVWAAAFSAAALRLVAHPTSKATARMCELEADRAVELYQLLQRRG